MSVYVRFTPKRMGSGDNARKQLAATAQIHAAAARVRGDGDERMRDVYGEGAQFLVSGSVGLSILNITQIWHTVETAFSNQTSETEGETEYPTRNSSGKAGVRMKKSMALITAINGVLLILLVFSACSDGGYISPGINDYSFELSGGYRYYHAGNNDPDVVSQLVDPKGNMIVDGGVEKLAWDEHTILVQRDAGRYYVINVADHELYGPSSKSNFDTKRVEWGVSDQLTLKDVSAYRNSGG